MRGGIFNSPAAIIFNRVDFPNRANGQQTTGNGQRTKYVIKI